MKIIIDYREHSLYDSCINKTLSLGDGIIEKENLTLGDVQIQKEHGEQMIIIERKTIQDLLSSIKANEKNRYNFFKRNKTQIRSLICFGNVSLFNGVKSAIKHYKSVNKQGAS